VCCENYRPMHYDVIASRDCRTAARKHYTAVRRSREKALWGTDAVRYRRPWLLYVRPHVTDLLLPAPSTGCGRPARFMLHTLISASLRRQDDRHYWWSQRVVCPCRTNYSATLACPLQSANAFSLWVLSRQVWMQLQLEHRFWKNVTGALFWIRVPDNRILLNNLNNVQQSATELVTFIMSTTRLRSTIQQLAAYMQKERTNKKYTYSGFFSKISLAAFILASLLRSLHAMCIAANTTVPTAHTETTITTTIIITETCCHLVNKTEMI